jgi:GntR family transcriptional regulator
LGYGRFETPSSFARRELQRAVEEELEPGQKMPSEQALAAQLGVSRNTIREALEELETSGLVSRVWGRGTFVSQNIRFLQQSLTELVPLPWIIRRAGLEYGLADFAYSEHDGRGPAHDELGLDKSVPLWKISRLLLGDGQPVIYLIDYLPKEQGGVSADPARFGEDMWGFLESQWGFSFDYAVAFFEAVAAVDDARDRLCVEEGTPLAFIKQTAFTQDGGPIVYTESYVRTDVMSLHVVRRRR